MGLFNWFRKFNNNYSTVAQPILKQTKKNMKFDWTNDYEIAFKGLKLLLQNSSIFTCYDLDFQLAVDILCHELWYMLIEEKLFVLDPKNWPLAKVIRTNQT